MVNVITQNISLNLLFENPGRGSQAFLREEVLSNLSWGKRGDIKVIFLEFKNFSVCINFIVVTNYSYIAIGH